MIPVFDDGRTILRNGRRHKFADETAEIGLHHKRFETLHFSRSQLLIDKM